MHFEDLSRYSYTKMTSRAALKNVGWLATDVPFDQGPEPPGLLEKIQTATSITRNPMRGIHGCPFCGHEHVRELVEGREALLGMSEVWFPSPSNEVVYIAPSLLLHYVRRHGYLPPAEFVQAALALPANEAEWDTPCGAYRKLVKRFGA